ncbi:MAG: hypothetical protein FWD22_06465 [Treponema sp.]|nr:hypothetical protein [Treponema sp.]
MMGQTFEERKETALRAARAQGIVDVVQASDDYSVSIDTLELATKLTQEHGSELCKEFDERRKTQK